MTKRWVIKDKNTSFVVQYPRQWSVPRLIDALHGVFPGADFFFGHHTDRPAHLVFPYFEEDV